MSDRAGRSAGTLGAMVFVDRRSFVLVGVVAVACGGDSGADGDDDSTGNDSTQGDDDDDDGSTSATESSDGGSETDDGADTTAADTSTGTTGCVAHDECRDPLTPACNDGTCSPCTAADAPACSELDAALPVCAPDGGCVECTADDATACVENTPVCDVSTSSCIRCTAHEQCPDSACDIETGACFETDCVVDVDADGDGDYLDVGSAVDGETDDACVLRVHTPDDESFYSGQVQIVARKIALLGVDPTHPEMNSGDGALQAVGGSVVYASRMTITGGVLVDDATFHVDGSELLNASFAPLRATSPLARVRVSNTWISNRAGFEPALMVDAGELEAVYTTIVGASVGVSCDEAASVSLRNSFLVSEFFETPAIDCSPLDAEYSAFEAEVAGRGNAAVGEFSGAWLDSPGGLTDRLSADFPAALATTARWTTGDPTVDIDGDLRPDRDGTMDFAGADVFVAR
jgi:hypothetical protein